MQSDSATILLLLISFPAGLGLEKPNSGLDPGETFFPNSVSDLGSAETFQISRNVGLVIDENVCLLDSQPWIKVKSKAWGRGSPCSIKCIF